MKRTGFKIIPIFTLFLLLGSCGSLDNSDATGGEANVTLLLKNPDESASGTAKAVEGGAGALAAAKADATLSVTSCDITCGTVSKSVSFASGASEVSAEVNCLAGSNVSISATCAESSKKENSVNFGFTCSTTANITGSETITCTGRFLNLATRSSGDCRYARFAQANSTQITAECGFSSALTNTQKTTAKCNVELCAANTCTSPGTIDASSDGLLDTKSNPYIIIEGGLNNPTCFKYTTSGTKELRGRGSWVTDNDGNTKARCQFGVRHWRQFDSDRNLRYAASCTKDGSTWVTIPSSGIAEGKTGDASDGDVANLTSNLGSCPSDNNCSSGFCASNSICGAAAPVSYTTVSDLAGDGNADSDNGSATTASFSGPTGVCITPNGNSLFVMDFGNNLVRKIDFTVATTSSSYVTTLCGNTTAGHVTGACSTVARMNNPKSCVVNANNNTLYVLQESNSVVSKITPLDSSAQLTTVAGSGTPGFTNGTGTSCTFSTPKGIAMDSDENLYIADSGNNAIRKVTSAGVCTTLAGGTQGSSDGTGTSAKFDEPFNVTIDSTKTFLYVTDQNNRAIRKINISSGVVTTLISGSSNFTASLAGIWLDPWDASLYIADLHAIQKISGTSGSVSAAVSAGAASTAGTTNGSLTSARFNTIRGIMIDPDGTDIYIVDNANNKIRLIQ